MKESTHKGLLRRLSSKQNKRRNEMKRLVCAAVLTLILGFSTLVNAELQPRQGGLVYDTDFGITWISAPTGTMHWGAAVSWTASLGPGWRLPTALNSDASGPCYTYNCTGSEMGHLYYTELRNGAGGPLANTGPVDYLYSYVYWSGTENVNHDEYAWGFDFRDGFQAMGYLKDSSYAYALAVHSGDVGVPVLPPAPTVPLPGTILLLGPGLVGLAAVRRRLKK
jgi:hypothetical protein